MKDACELAAEIAPELIGRWLPFRYASSRGAPAGRRWDAILGPQLESHLKGSGAGTSRDQISEIRSPRSDLGCRYVSRPDLRDQISEIAARIVPPRVVHRTAGTLLAVPMEAGVCPVPSLYLPCTFPVPSLYLPCWQCPWRLGSALLTCCRSGASPPQVRLEIISPRSDLRDCGLLRLSARCTHDGGRFSAAAHDAIDGVLLTLLCSLGEPEDNEAAGSAAGGAAPPVSIRRPGAPPPAVRKAVEFLALLAPSTDATSLMCDTPGRIVETILLLHYTHRSRARALRSAATASPADDAASTPIAASSLAAAAASSQSSPSPAASSSAWPAEFLQPGLRAEVRRDRD